MNKTVKAIDKEIEKLKTLQSKIIKQEQLFNYKLEKSKLKASDKKKKLAEFNEKYLNYRIKIWARWIKLLDKRVDEVGRPKNLNINEGELDDLRKSL